MKIYLYIHICKSIVPISSDRKKKQKQNNSVDKTFPFIHVKFHTKNSEPSFKTISNIEILQRNLTRQQYHYHSNGTCVKTFTKGTDDYFIPDILLSI